MNCKGCMYFNQPVRKCYLCSRNPVNYYSDNYEPQEFKPELPSTIRDWSMANANDGLDRRTVTLAEKLNGILLYLASKPWEEK